MSRPALAAALLACLLAGLLAAVQKGAVSSAAIAGLLATAGLAGLMAAIAVEDARAMIVPNRLAAATFAAGLAVVLAEALLERFAVAPALLQAALATVLCGGLFWAMREGFYRLRGYDGLGLGDVKLAAAVGPWLGFERFLIGVLLAAITALTFVALWTAVKGPWPRDQRLPFATTLAPAFWLVWYLLAPGLLGGTGLGG